MRTCPDCTTYMPEQGCPSLNTISPAEKWRITARCARNCSSFSVSPENIAVWDSTAAGLVLVCGTLSIVPEGTGEPARIDRRAEAFELTPTKEIRNSARSSHRRVNECNGPDYSGYHVPLSA